MGLVGLIVGVKFIGLVGFTAWLDLMSRLVGLWVWIKFKKNEILFLQILGF
jgi:hypothetical protein